MGKIKKRVLIQMRDLRLGNGIATCIMNYYQHTVSLGYHIDFLLNRNVDSPFVELVKENGGAIFMLPVDTSKPCLENFKFIEKTLNNEYDIIHVNISGLNALTCLFYSYCKQIPTRIYHAHNPKENSSLKAVLRSLIYETPSVWFANSYAACSQSAGSSLFGKKSFFILRNAMDTRKYIFDPQAREILRSQLGVTNKFVVGTVCRIAEQKNPFFIIDVFEKIAQKNKDAILLWAGDGPLRDVVQQYIVDKKLEKHVMMLGVRSDVEKLYSAMDAFFLPSTFEGLGIVFIEAQISGVDCFASQNVPADVEISPKMHRVSLHESKDKWANLILLSKNENRNEARKYAELAGFEITSVQDDLAKLYRK